MSGRWGSLRPHPRHTWTGNHGVRRGAEPMASVQLALGDPRGGVRGYEDAEMGGAAASWRGSRSAGGSGTSAAPGDAGIAFFAEVGGSSGRRRPLGAPPWYMPSVGVALLAAVPPGSRRIWRLDFAVPLDRTAGARFGMRLTNEDRTRAFWIEPNDVRRNRERSGLVTAFVVP